MLPKVVVVPAPVYDRGLSREAEEEVRRHLASEPGFGFASIEAIVDVVFNDVLPWSCLSASGVECPAVILARDDVHVVWVRADGGVELLSVREMFKTGNPLYTYDVDVPDGLKLYRLQTIGYQHVKRFWDEVFERKLREGVFETLYGWGEEIRRWRALTLTLSGNLGDLVEAIADATRRYVELLCLSGGVNMCPGILLDTTAGRMSVKILRLSRRDGFIVRMDLSSLLRRRPDP